MAAAASFAAGPVQNTPRFRCARCQQNSLTTGRKKVRVRGLLDWVCAGCVKALGKSVGA